MKRGHGKNKGSSFERWVCVKLSLAVTQGTRKDVFWRSAISGGRATVHNRKRIDVRQAGDVCAVAPEGNALIEKYYFECKFYRDLKIDRFVVENRGPLAKFWKVAKIEAERHNREPVLIAKQNNLTPFVIWCPWGRSYQWQITTFEQWRLQYGRPVRAARKDDGTPVPGLLKSGRKIPRTRLGG